MVLLVLIVSISLGDSLELDCQKQQIILSPSNESKWYWTMQFVAGNLVSKSDLENANAFLCLGRMFVFFLKVLVRDYLVPLASCQSDDWSTNSPQRVQWTKFSAMGRKVWFQRNNIDALTQISWYHEWYLLWFIIAIYMDLFTSLTFIFNTASWQ